MEIVIKTNSEEEFEYFKTKEIESIKREIENVEQRLKAYKVYLSRVEECNTFAEIDRAVDWFEANEPESI